jgi:hypothetical protein
VERNNVGAVKHIVETKDLEKYSDKKLVSLAAGGSVEMFKLLKGSMWKLKFDTHVHPLVVAAGMGNTAVVQLVNDNMKEGKFYVGNGVEVREAAIKMASRKGSVSTLMLLCKNREHIHNAFRGLVSNGHTNKATRLMAHSNIDFSYNKFELLILCSPYIDELFAIARHKSVIDKYDSLPDDYYRIIADASKEGWEERKSHMDKHYKKMVGATATAILTGAKMYVPVVGAANSSIVSLKHPHVYSLNTVTQHINYPKYTPGNHVYAHKSAMSGADVVDGQHHKPSRNDVRTAVKMVNDHYSDFHHKAMKARKLDKYQY